MLANKQADIITACLDLLAGYEHQPAADIPATLQSINSTLSEFEQPTSTAQASTLGVYLLTNNAQNAIQLSQLGLWAFLDSCKVASVNLEMALSLLVD